jgi:hypothetical protein
MSFPAIAAGVNRVMPEILAIAPYLHIMIVLRTNACDYSISDVV